MKISFRTSQPVTPPSILQRASAQWIALATDAFPMLGRWAGLALFMSAVLALAMLVSLQQVVSAAVVTAKQRQLAFAQQGVRAQLFGRCGSDAAKQVACGQNVAGNDTAARSRLAGPN